MISCNGIIVDFLTSVQRYVTKAMDVLLCSTDCTFVTTDILQNNRLITVGRRVIQDLYFNLRLLRAYNCASANFVTMERIQRVLLTLQ